MCWHYVDDYSGAETSSTASSSFTSFEALNAILGARMKPSKRKPPAQEQTLLGVDNVISADWIETKPSENKTRRAASKVQLFLDENDFSPADSGSLAGSVGWMGCWYWGRVARAVLRPLYARSNNFG